MSAGTDSTTEASAISLPKGGGAISGLGETFTADLFTGTGNYAVPIAVPAGRLGLAPSLNLGYSSGNGNGLFGTGWQLSLSGVTRRTSRGVPRYVDETDVFLLAGAEDLVPVAGQYPGRVRYRPRTEGLFARVEHVRDATGDYWEVRTRDGLSTRYGTPIPADADPAWRDPAAVADPADPDRVFGWRVTESRDTHGNLIRYEYVHDAGDDAGHRWDQPLLSRISYVDYGDPAAPSFLVTVDFGYETRPDPFADYRAGFEIRTTQRCTTIQIATHPADGVDRVSREYRFSYDQAPFSGASLLSRVDVVGIDGDTGTTEAMPPLTFGYTGFDATARRFAPVTGPGLPAGVLSDPGVALVDLHGTGLPDLVQLGPAARFWRNLGGGRFAMASRLTSAPPFALNDPGVQLMDADGDGRPDLLVSAGDRGARTAGATSGYFPMTFGGGWSSRSFRSYRQAPSVSLTDPAVKLIDLDGDGLTDVLRSGTRLECWFNDPDPKVAWSRTAVSNGTGPQVNLADPAVRLADMTGDGLQDIVLVRSGNIAYWPNLGHGRWGERITMRDSPRLPDGYDPHKVLLGDVDGDGVADLVYVDQRRVLLWGNQSGNGWTPRPIVVTGTPEVAGTDAVQLSDLHGTGMAGLLFSRVADRSDRPYLRFLDFTGGVKPHLLAAIDNHLGALTTIAYRPSTVDYLRDAADPATRWRTTLPFPVHVVATVESTDRFSGGRLTVQYRYHHGYWDGVEREFRGFAMVEHFDAEDFATAPDEHFSPPTLTRSWFHPGPVAAVQAGDWSELDLSDEYSTVDTSLLSRPADQAAFLAGLPRDARRVALRAMRGHLLRAELYALDGTERAGRPYTVTEAVVGVRQEDPGVFFPFPIGGRTTEWERGTEPMTRMSFPGGFDAYGFAATQVDVAVPRGRDPLSTGVPLLATYSNTEFARRDDADLYLVDRVCRVGTYEVVNDGSLSVTGLLAAVAAGAPVLPDGPPPADGGDGPGGPAEFGAEQDLPAVALRPTGHARTYYDGPDFVGLALGQLGEHGLPARAEKLAFTDGLLDTLGTHPVYLMPGAVAWTDEYPAEFRTGLAPLAGYLHYGPDEVPGSPGGYYTTTARHRFDARGLPVGALDPFGAQSRIGYDVHDLLPVQSVDPVGLATQVEYDYRLLKPTTLTDVNGNTHVVEFSPAGLVTAEFVRGKNGEGDQTAPGTRVDYDLLAVDERGEPASVRVTHRVHHDTDAGVPAGERDDVLVSVQYSDGFGRVLQTRSQADDTLFGDPTFGGGVITADLSLAPGDTVGRTRGVGDPDNVVVSGWQVYDNKGRVVRKYEPFFSTGYGYDQPADAQLGQSAVYFYDPRGQLVRVVNPDGSQLRVVLGVPADLTDPDTYAPTAWEAYTYDANDNAGRTNPTDAASYASHWNTPSSVELDALGRTVVAVARDGLDPLITTSVYDIQGNLLSVTDATGRVAFRYTVDLVGRRWRSEGIDGGRHDGVPDALGGTVETRDSRGALTLGTFDVLHRVSRIWSRDDATGPVTLRQRVDYGDAGDPAQPAGDRAAARARNVLGRAAASRDEAGSVSLDLLDFKGNTLQATQRVIGDAPILATYQAAQANGWQVAPFRVDWTPRAGQTPQQRDAELLDATAYLTTSEYDALNRVTRHLLPTDVTGNRPEVLPTYNRAGALDQVRLSGTVYVQRIAYDAKGQRALVAYGNGVMTRYAYDPHTFRLARLRTEPYALVGAATYHPQGPVVQDYGYRHDLVGNVLTLSDRTPGSGIPNNPVASAVADPRLRTRIGTGGALDRVFTYDPVYRLLTATGREHLSPPPGAPWPGLPRGTDVTLTQAYQETYTYDQVGNVLRMRHSSVGGFDREFAVDPGSNRLRRMTIGDTPFDYTFDASGNVVAEADSRHFTWNHANQLTTFGTQTPGAEPSIHAHYLYDAAGQRVKKLVRRQGGAVETTHYLDEVFEHHRWTASPAAENNHVHVMDDRQRVALVRIGPAQPDDGGPAIAYHLGDHLGSSTAVLDETGRVTNREEYTPYGETSFGSFTRKRYRFTGREHDEESGLSRHGYRYYAPWTLRWTAVDPTGLTGGVNQYAYCAGAPLSHVDPTGTAPKETVIGNLRAAIRAEHAAERAYNVNREIYEDAETHLEKLRAKKLVDMSPETLKKNFEAENALGAARQELETRWDTAIQKLKEATEAAKKKLGVEATQKIIDSEHAAIRDAEEAELSRKIDELEQRMKNKASKSKPKTPGDKGGAGSNGNGRSRPAQRAPERGTGTGERGPGRGRGGAVRPGIAGTAGTAVRAAAGVAGALSMLDMAVDIGQDLAHGHVSQAAGKASEGIALTAAFDSPAAPVAAAYVVARVYWADRENIDDAAGEAADRLVGRNHPYLGGTIAAGYAVGVSVGRAGVAVGQSVARGAGHVVHAAGAVYHFVGSLFD